MDSATESGIENSVEHKFARDLIRFVLHERWPSLQWEPNGIFLERSSNSSFTPQFQNAVIKELELSKRRHQEIYEKYFPDKSFLKDSYYETLSKAKDAFVKNNFHPKFLVKFAALLAKFAGFSYSFGLSSAPEQSYELLIAAVRELKQLGKFENITWDGVQDWLEGRYGEKTESFSENKVEPHVWKEIAHI